mgnify:CR=1 FL=1
MDGVFVPNISFGLPARDVVNSTFFALALENGLSAAIMNPYSADMLKTYYAYKALKGMDENCAEYIGSAESFVVTVTSVAPAAPKTTEEYSSELQHAVIKGFKDKAGELTKNLLSSVDPLKIVNNEIIPALNTVGVGFENKTVYFSYLCNICIC